MSKRFKLTKKQVAQTKLCASQATFILAYGGGRSGKTFNFLRNVTLRALKAPGSRHAVFRRHFSHAKQAIALETWPKLIELCFKGLQYRLDKTDWYIEFANGAQIWIAGLDDNERMEKVLGKEYCTLYGNEISELLYSHFEMMTTRLAQEVEQDVGGDKKIMPLKVYLDCNPPLKSHWSYKLFFVFQNPKTKQPIKDRHDYAKIQMNPVDNRDNISDKYIELMEASSPRMRKRFYEGEYGDDNPNALFSETTISTYRVLGGHLPEMVRIVVGVDPSGAGTPKDAAEKAQDPDAIGIVCGGLGTDGKAYLLEDCTITDKPEKWGKVAAILYERRLADVLVCEKNFGGDMCRFVIQTAKKDANVKMVNASRGKIVRAEPFSALYDQGKIVHVGYFNDLEDELLGFTTLGYIGEGSPNRADAWIWVLAELFPSVLNPPKEIEAPKPIDNFWSMA